MRFHDSPLEPSPGSPPSKRGVETLTRTRAFLRDTAVPLCAAHAAEHGDTTFALEPDGRRRWLPAHPAGRINIASAITERRGGSDVTSPVTRAVRDGDGWVLMGHKYLITGGAGR